MTPADARAYADELTERIAAYGVSVPHPEAARMQKAADVIRDLATQLEQASPTTMRDLATQVNRLTPEPPA
jgi:hypothetical protein